MATDRRAFLSASMAAAFLPWLVRSAAAGPNLRAAYLASAARPDGGYALAALESDGSVAGTVPLPGRGHGFAVRPGGTEAVAFARRPGAFAVAFDLSAGHTRQFATPEDRHFYGHGVYSADGRLLYAAENAFESGEGRIGIYDARAGYCRVGEFDTFGIGPHEIVRRGSHLIVANGGIRTHPDMGRQKLNLDTMRASLVWLDAGTGQLLKMMEIPQTFSRLSLRHLAVTGAGAVVVGGQWQGARDDVPLLAWCAQTDGGLRPVESVAHGRDLHGYIGSVAVDRSGTYAAVTSPRANAVEAWHIATSRKVAGGHIADASGLSATRDAGLFMVSSGTGALHILDAAAATIARVQPLGPAGILAGIMFDNHMMPVLSK